MCVGLKHLRTAVAEYWNPFLCSSDTFESLEPILWNQMSTQHQYASIICHYCTVILSVQPTNLPEMSAPLLSSLLQPTSAFGMMNQKTIQSFHATFLARFLPQLGGKAMEKHFKLKPRHNLSYPALHPNFIFYIIRHPTIHQFWNIITFLLHWPWTIKFLQGTRWVWADPSFVPRRRTWKSPRLFHHQAL